MMFEKRLWELGKGRYDEDMLCFEFEMSLTGSCLGCLVLRWCCTEDCGVSRRWTKLGGHWRWTYEGYACHSLYFFDPRPREEPLPHVPDTHHMSLTHPHLCYGNGMTCFLIHESKRTILHLSWLCQAFVTVMRKVVNGYRDSWWKKEEMESLSLRICFYAY